MSLVFFQQEEPSAEMEPVSQQEEPAPAAPEQNIESPKPEPKKEAPRKAKEMTLDDLPKLKALLDQGIITQEEFDQKKKEILGL